MTEEAAEQATEQSEAKEPHSMEIHYNITGPRRKELAAAVGIELNKSVFVEVLYV